MSGHTPGPWVWDDNLEDLRPLWEMGMSQGFGYIDWLDQSSKEANARLIAAAPDMLKALKTARHRIECLYVSGDADGPVDAWTVEIDEAIARAEGRS